MKVLNDLMLLRGEAGPLILAVGFFDGLHRGHVKVIDRAIAGAKERNGKAWVLTFDNHPLKVLKPRAAPPLLTSNRHKLDLLSRLGVDGCLVIPFTRELADQPPACFIEKLKDSSPSLAEIVVGCNWRFGRRREGTPALLSRLAGKHGLRVRVVRPAIRKGAAISSTRIRAEVMRGNMEEAAAMLNRPFSVRGTVVRGKTLARKLGFPTANLDVRNEALPPLGVYAVFAFLAGCPAGANQRRDAPANFQCGDPMEGVMNIGIKPTFPMERNGKPTLELHLFDFACELYGLEITVFFMKRIRAERRFSSPYELKRQIALDAVDARGILGEKKMKQSLYRHPQLIL